MKRYAVLLALVVLAAVPSARSEEPGVAAPALNEISNRNPNFLVAVDVNRPSLEYRQGDVLEMRVASEMDAYLYVYYQQADGKTFQIFPNRHHPDNQVKARQAVQLPDPAELWTWQVGAPFGKEKIKVIASRKKLENDFKPRFDKGGRFIRLSKDDVKGVELEIGEEVPEDWAETDLTITTYADDQTPEAAIAQRVGLFIGVSKHKYARDNSRNLAKKLAAQEIAANNITEEAKIKEIQEKWEKEYECNYLCNDLNTCHRDARKLAQAMTEVGRLTDHRILTNEDATRANIEKLITQWLPSVTRPGDTVVLCIAGHSGQLKDESGEEPDGQDEYYCPADYLSLTRQQREKLLEFWQTLKTDEERAEYGWVASLLNAANPYFEKHGDQAPLFMESESMITDDQLARWLQNLPGRQIVMVAQSCHAGGYGDAPGGVDTKKNQRAYLWDNEIGRMRAMGQKEFALLASSESEKESYGREEDDMSVMSSELFQCLMGTSGKMTLEEAHRQVQEGMKKYFASHPNTPVHNPFMINHCSRPVVLKP